MSIQTILIISGVLFGVAVLINVGAYILEKVYKKKMNKLANK